MILTILNHAWENAAVFGLFWDVSGHFLFYSEMIKSKENERNGAKSPISTRADPLFILSPQI